MILSSDKTPLNLEHVNCASITFCGGAQEAPPQKKKKVKVQEQDSLIFEN